MREQNILTFQFLFIIAKNFEMKTANKIKFIVSINDLSQISNIALEKVEWEIKEMDEESLQK